MTILLWPIARFFSLAARARVQLYRSGRLRQRRLLRPVVSVGNLSVGGTGKTPFVIWLFRELTERSVKPTVLTRGYRRAGPRRTLLLENLESGGLAAGDEVEVMLRHGITPIGVDADRFRAGQALEARAEVDLHLLDDGFQHLALARDLDIVLVDSSRVPWKDDLLPAGRLREPPSALKRAAVIVLTRVHKWTDVEHITAHLRLLVPRAELFLARTRLAGQAAVPGCPPPGPAPISSRLVLAFAAIGNPKTFFADLCLAGVKVVGTRTFRDHHRYTEADLQRLEKRAREVGAEELVTTEKDAVKLPVGLRARLEMPLRVVRMELEVERGGELVERVARLAGK